MQSRSWKPRAVEISNPSMSRLSLTLLPSNYHVCVVCGQTHEDGSNHLFDYPDEVEEELQCKVCHQPLVDPYDTPCCHTFCKICISKHLRQESRCPIDNSIVTTETIRQSSLLVRKILDKLQVVCPNNGYCDLIMQRSVLEQHLAVQCPGSYVECPQKDRGCEYNGPRFNLEDHLWTCGYASDRSRGEGYPVISCVLPSANGVVCGLFTCNQIILDCTCPKPMV